MKNEKISIFYLWPMKENTIINQYNYFSEPLYAILNELLVSYRVLKF